MDGSLVFLTSTSGSVPSGRNARAIARSAVFQGEDRLASAPGTFHVYSSISTQERVGARQRTRLPSVRARRMPPHRSIGENQPEQRPNSISRTLGPQNITIDGLLATATVRIRHQLTSVLRKHPSLVRDVVRRTMWSTATFASGTLYLTREVHSAVEYLEHKISTDGQSRQAHDVELQKYGVALTELQRSLRDPERRMQPSVLAASHILAICEMLHDTMGDKYLNFIDGIVAISNLQAFKGDHYARGYIRSRAGGIMIEALLAKRNNAILDQSWSQTLMTAGDEGHISPKDAVSFAESTDLIFAKPPTTGASIIQSRSESDKIEAAAKARRLQATIKRSIENDLLSASTARYPCPGAVIRSERLAVMLGLDDFISGITEPGEDPLELAHGANNTFYADVICVT